MSRTIYAFLIGIDVYPAPIPTLSGCVNDIEAFAVYLGARVNKDKAVALRIKTLKNAEATRDAVIQGFQEHFEPARTGDVALFYYSGHGSQEPTPEEFWSIEPDHFDETLVCYDSRSTTWDLADKELAKLIDEVAVRGPHVLAILDCCHSGSGTRDASEVVRRVSTDRRRRPIESFVLSADQIRATATRGSFGQAGKAWNIPTTQGRHILLAACAPDQEAKEVTGDGQRRGAFSFHLSEALRSANGIPTYRDLYARVGALVASQVRNQSPQLEVNHSDDLDAVFLDGAIQPAPTTYTVSVDQEGHWSINAGAAHGIPSAAPDDTTRLALFPFDAPAVELADVSKALAMARVVDTLPTSSIITLDGSAELDPTTTYKALILSLPVPALTFTFEGDSSSRDLVLQALATASPERTPSSFVRMVRPDETPSFRVTGQDGKFVITMPEDNLPLVKEIDGINETGAVLAVRRLEHMARWKQIAALRNAGSSIQPTDVKIAVLVNGVEVPGMEIRLEYRLENGKEVAPTFGIQITNMGTQTIYCGLLDLTQRHGVFAELFRTGCVKLEPNQTAHACDGRPIPATVPDEVWRQGAVEYKDLLKLIVCTREFDARLLRQPNLDMPGTRGLSGTRSGALGSSLNRLLAKVQTRELGNDSGITEIADWQAMDVSFTTVRPHLTAALPDAGKSVVLVGGVTVEGHRSLKAQARLMSTPLSTRDLNGLRLPHQFYDAPDLTSPLNFTPARGFDPGLSVLDLTDVSNIEAVTAESPLRLSVPAALAWNEHVIPIAYDGRFFIPLGRIEKRTEQNTVIAIDRLPPPLADGRSLTGAIKIFFQKIVSRVDGLDFPFPRLAAIDVSTEVIGPTVTAPSQVGQRVAGAQRIGLFIHGIIGSTDTMVPGLQLGKFADGRTLVGLYDVVLTFDYENLNTPIEENARLLKAKLEAVGLGAGHGKKLDIIAHSMGGLVSRWFIEHEGGQEIVSRLIMLGTPNGGSPWPKVVDWATVTLGIGLNQMGAIPWTTALLGWLSRLIESPTVTLEQMQSGSELLGQLKASADLGIPYYLIAGNTSIIPAASQGDDAENTSALGCLLKRLTSPDLLHHVANPFFFGHPNDIAVSIASMEDIATGWRLRDIFVAACDHLSYFQAPAGLVAFAQVLAKVD